MRGGHRPGVAQGHGVGEPVSGLRRDPAVADRDGESRLPRRPRRLARVRCHRGPKAAKTTRGSRPVRVLHAQSVITPSAKAPTPTRPKTRVKDPPAEKNAVGGELVGEGSWVVEDMRGVVGGWGRLQGKTHSASCVLRGDRRDAGLIKSEREQWNDKMSPSPTHALPTDTALSTHARRVPLPVRG